jgi:hypothetical protein
MAQVVFMLAGAPNPARLRRAPNLLDLRDAESNAVFLVFLAIGGDGFGGGFMREEGARGEKLFGKVTRLHSADRLQPAQ